MTREDPVLDGVFPLSGCNEPDFEAEPTDLTFLGGSDYKFSIPAHEKILNKILTALGSLLYSPYKAFTPEAAEQAARYVYRQVGLHPRKMSLVTESLYPKFAGRKIEQELVFDIAIRLAGNIELFKRDQAIPETYDLITPVWAPVTVFAVEKTDRMKYRKVGVHEDAGPFAGLRVHRTMSVQYIQYVMRSIGLGRFCKADAEELFNMRFSVLMVRGERGIELQNFCVSSSQRKHNKLLSDLRRQDRPCAMGRLLPCSLCDVTFAQCDCATKN